MSQREHRDYDRAQLLRARPGRLFQVALRAAADKQALAKTRTVDKVGETADLPGEENEEARA